MVLGPEDTVNGVLSDRAPVYARVIVRVNVWFAYRCSHRLTPWLIPRSPVGPSGVV